MGPASVVRGGTDLEDGEHEEDEEDDDDDAGDVDAPVSYTHLTLPTIYSV